MGFSACETGDTLEMGFLVSSATTENNVNGGGEWSKVVELLKFNVEDLLCWKVKRALGFVIL